MALHQTKKVVFLVFGFLDFLKKNQPNQSNEFVVKKYSYNTSAISSIPYMFFFFAEITFFTSTLIYKIKQKMGKKAFLGT